MFRNAELYLNTIKYLKYAQIRHQISFAVKRKFLLSLISRRINRMRAPAETARIRLIPKAMPAVNCHPAERRFNFLNHSVTYAPKIKWNDPAQEKLWLYNLHYFDYLLPLASDVSRQNYQVAKSLLTDWIAENPVGRGNGWEPYPLSLRLVNWLYFYRFYESYFRGDDEFRTEFLNSLYRQYRFLARFIEYHLMANHLFANLKALLWSSLFFREEKAFAGFRRRFLQQVDEQILPDGGHFELSPMYHSIILTDLLDMVNLLTNSDPGFSEPVSERLREDVSEFSGIADKMLDWLALMRHPDGKIALFGDSAFQVAPEFPELMRYYRQLTGGSYREPPPVSASFLKDSGYAVMQGAGQKLIADGGRLGVNYQPGHAHCDLTTYEYSFNGVRFIVDSGVGSYLPDERRRLARSVWGHNVTVVNDLEQAEIWKAFRMGRRVQPEKSELVRGENRLLFTVQYVNRLRKKRAYRLRREIEMVYESYFRINDSVIAGELFSLKSLIHLHPDVEPETGTGRAVLRRAGKEVVLLWDARLAKAKISDGFYHPEFGKQVPAKMLILQPVIDRPGDIYYIISPAAFEADATAFLDRLKNI